MSLTEAFHTRVHNVFAALEEHSPQIGPPAWCVNSAIVPQRGDDTETDSDDGDQEHQECIEMLLDVEEEEGGRLSGTNGKLPSASACRAFEAEEEEDAFDRVAMGELNLMSGNGMGKPALQTQVAEDNIYDRILAKQVNDTGDSTSPGDALSSQAAGGHAPGLCGMPQRESRGGVPGEVPGAGVQPSAAPARAKKRVRFQQDVDTGRRTSQVSAEGGPRDASHSGRGASSRLKGWRPALKPRGMQSITPRELTVQPRGSYVPEHVRRPHAFTCYTLDAPVIVGSGDDSGPGSTAAHQTTVEAMHDAVAAAHTRVGAGGADGSAEYGSRSGAEVLATDGLPDVVEFQPRKRADRGIRKHAAPPNASAHQPGSSRTVASSEQEEAMAGGVPGHSGHTDASAMAGSAVDDIIQTEAPQAKPTCVRGAKKARRLRVRASLSESEDDVA